MTQLFSPDYTSARQRFLEVAARAGANFETYKHPRAKGPEGEDLHVDIARFGARYAPRVLSITSGLHGVEGFLGSAAQTNAIEKKLFDKLPADTAIVVVHALNPYGFAHLRRCDEQGIDLNRNFVPFVYGQQLPYQEHEHTGWLMDRLFVPQPRQNEVDQFRAEHGDAVYRRALVQGQYRFPLGTCYGGAAPSWSNKVWLQIQGRHQDVGSMLHIDLHTGYGPVGGAVVMPADDTSAMEARRLKKWWGDKVEYTVPGPGAALTGISGPIESSFIHRRQKGFDYLSVTVESGTVPFAEVVDILVKDHQRVAQGEPATATSNAAIKRAYAPEDTLWQRSAVEAFTDVIAGGVAALHTPSRLRPPSSFKAHKPD